MILAACDGYKGFTNPCDIPVSSHRAGIDHHRSTTSIPSQQQGLGALPAQEVQEAGQQQLLTPARLSHQFQAHLRTPGLNVPVGFGQ